MKWFAAILMIANVVIFLGVSDREIENIASQGDARPDVNKESMLLLKEVAPEPAAPDGVEFSATITAPNVSVETDLPTTSVASEDVASISIDELGAATVTIPGDIEQAAPGSQIAVVAAADESSADWSCYRIGPFKDLSLWRTAQDWVTDRGLGYQPVRSESRELRAVRVYVGPFASISAAQPAIENLKQRELDHFVYLKDGGEARISLGYFTQEELAVKFVDYLVSQQIEAKSQPEYRTLGPFDWMDVKISSGARGVLLSRDWGSDVTTIDEQPCPQG